MTRLKNDALDARCAAQGAPAGVSLTVRGADRRVGRHAAHRTDDLAIGALRPTRRRVSQAFVTGDRAGKVLASGELCGREEGRGSESEGEKEEKGRRKSG